MAKTTRVQGAKHRFPQNLGLEKPESGGNTQDKCLLTCMHLSINCNFCCVEGRGRGMQKYRSGSEGDLSSSLQLLFLSLSLFFFFFLSSLSLILLFLVVGSVGWGWGGRRWHGFASPLHGFVSLSLLLAGDGLCDCSLRSGFAMWLLTILMSIASKALGGPQWFPLGYHEVGEEARKSPQTGRLIFYHYWC